MRFKISFAIFLAMTTLVTIIFWNSIARVNKLQWNYDEGIGDPFTGMVIKNLRGYSQTDTITCDRLFFRINSINPLDFKVSIHRCHVKIGKKTGLAEDLWFIPIRFSGHIRIWNGTVRVGDNLFTKVNTRLELRGFGPEIKTSIQELTADYQGQKISVKGEIGLTPFGVEVEAGSLSTRGINIGGISGSIYKRSGHLNGRGRVDLTLFSSFKGSGEIEGEIEWEEEGFNVDLNGLAFGLLDCDTIPIVINITGDTTKVIMPEIESEPGFASARFFLVGNSIKRGRIELDRFQIERFLPLSFVLTGEIIISGDRISGTLSGPDIDSLTIRGQDGIFRIIGRSGAGRMVFDGQPDSFLISFDRFPLGPIFNLKKIDGDGTVSGVVKYEKDNLSGELELTTPNIGMIKADFIKLVFPDLDLQDYTGNGKLEVAGLKIGRNLVGELTIDYHDRNLIVRSGDTISVEMVWEDSLLSIKRLSGRGHGVTIKNLDEFQISFKDDIKIQNLALSLNDGQVRGSVAMGKRPRFNLSGEKIRLNGISPDLIGVLSFRGDGDQIDYEIEGLNYCRSQLGRLKGSIIIGADKSLKVTGSGQGFKFILSERSLNLDLESFPLSRLWFLKPYLQIEKGVVSGTINLGKGAGGRCRAKVDQLTVIATKTRINNLTGIIAIKGKRIILSSFSARTEQGSFKGNGWIDLKDFNVDTLHLEIEFVRAYITIPNIHGYADGKLVIDAGRRIRIKGHFDVSDAIYSYSLSGISIPTHQEDDGVDLDLLVRAPTGVMLKGDLLNSELEGELRIKKRHGLISLSGDFSSNRGTIHYLDHILTLDYANVIFINDPEINPLIDLRASMPSRLGYRIIIRVTGRLREPIFNFSSEPAGLSEQDIISYLNTGFTWSEIQQMGSGDRISSLVSQRLIRLLTFSLARELKGISGLDYLDVELSQIRIGKYLRPNLFVSYTHNLGTFTSDAFEVDYLLRPRERVVIEKHEEGEYSVQYKIRFKF